MEFDDRCIRPECGTRRTNGLHSRPRLSRGLKRKVAIRDYDAHFWDRGTLCGTMLIHIATSCTVELPMRNWGGSGIAIETRVGEAN